MSIVNQTDIHTIITDPDGTKTLVDKADTMGKELKGLRLDHQPDTGVIWGSPPD